MIIQPHTSVIVPRRPDGGIWLPPSQRRQPFSFPPLVRRRKRHALVTTDKGPTQGSSDGDTTIAVTLVGTTNGASVVVCVIWAPNTTSLSSVDVGGQTATVQSTTLSSSAAIGRIEFATLDSLSSGGDKVITATLSANVAIGSGIIIAWSFTGTNTGGVFDKGANAAAAGTPSLSMTTVADNCHILGVLSIDTSTTPTAGTNYTGVDITDSDWWNYSEKDTDFDAGAAGSKTVNFTGVSSNYTLSAIALKPSAGGASVTYPQLERVHRGAFRGMLH